MPDLTIERGDYGFYVTGTLTNKDASPFNLTGYTASFKAWKEGNWVHPIVDGTADVVVATQGTWRYLVQSSDFITKGDYLCVVRATKTGAQETSQSYTVEVKEAP